MAKHTDPASVKPSLGLNKNANRSGVFLLVLMVGASLFSLWHGVEPDRPLVATSVVPDPDDALAAIPTTLKQLLIPDGQKIFGDRMILKTQIEAAGGLEHIMATCRFPEISVSTVKDWAQMQVDYGLARDVLTVADITEWYAQGKALAQEKLGALSEPKCRTQLMEFNASGPARFQQTRGVRAELTRRAAHPGDLKPAPTLP